MARRVEKQLADPIPIPTTGSPMAQKRSGTPRPNQTPFPLLSKGILISAVETAH